MNDVAKTAVPASIRTPDRVQSRLGPLEFRDGAPTEETLARVYDHLDFTRAFLALVDALLGVNLAARHGGIAAAGVEDDEVLVFSELVDARSLILTANADTVYAMGFLDLSRGPKVLEVPPRFLGALQDGWFRWLVDLGAPGPDRGEGGRYLVLPPGHDGPLPEAGFAIVRSRTRRAMWFGRMFLEGGSPKPAAEKIRKHTRVYPYRPGGVGTTFAAFLGGQAPLVPVEPPPGTVFHEGSGRSLNTIPPADFSFFELLDAVVQREPAGSLDPETLGSLAAIGIEKGKRFAPDARQKQVLLEALAVGNATSRCLLMRPRDPSWYHHPGSAWLKLPLFVSGYDFETPPPTIEGTRRDGHRDPERVTLSPPTGARALDLRTAYYYGAICVSPALAMRMTGAGSQYLTATVDADKRYLDGAKTYRLALPKGIPAEHFWSLTLYDNQTRSMLDTPQRHPRAGSQRHPSPAAEPGPDGSTTVYFAPAQPGGVGRGNWIQTVAGKGFFVTLRLYGPLEPFFDQSWRPGEVEAVG